MMRRRAAVWSLGIGSLAASVIAASQGSPVEATTPADRAVPAAESVETVLRATYVLPEGRGRELAAFLNTNAAPGIDVRSDQGRLTVVAPADAQQALGHFIEKCLSREPRPLPPDGFIPGGVVPNYTDPIGDDGFGDSPFFEGT